VLAELHGKLDPQGDDPVDRSEDLLTDAVFGAIRHLPYERVLAAVLAEAGVSVTADGLRRAQVLMWPRIPMPQWPGTIIEPDVIVIAGKAVIVFEAKLNSDFSTYTAPPPPGSRTSPEDRYFHQLAVQYAAVKAWAAGLLLNPPTIVAVTRGPLPPTTISRAEQDIDRLTSSPAPQRIRGVSWHDLAQVLHGVGGLRPNEQEHVSDVLALMEKRGVRRVFTGVHMEDYWLMTAAQRVAGDRLYPQLRTFFDDLTMVLDTDDIAWSQPGYKGMWLGGSSTSVSKPAGWTRGFVGAQYWPTAWPARSGKLGAGLALYGIFDFINPGFETGLSIPGPGAAAAATHWTPHLTALAEQLRTLTGCDIVLDSGDVTRPTKEIQTADVTEDWLTAVLGSLVNSAHLRIRRRTSVATLTVQEARTMIHDDRAALDQGGGALWELLNATGHIDGVQRS
jgi:hypothetical protein